VQDLIVGQAALVVIDIQKGGFDPVEVSGIPHMAGYRDRIDRVVTLVDACRAAGVPVIFVQELHRPNLVDFGRELDGAESVHCIEGAPGTELVDELVPGPSDYYVPKRRYSCFIGTDFEILLRGLGVSTLLLVGGLTDVCVHYTFADAHQRDFHVRVLEDCVGGSSPARHAASLDAMEYLQSGARRTSGEVLTSLGEVVPA
jgi:nicotinamidase-related amidase